MKEELKACPFCGDRCWINKDQYKPGVGYLYSVACPTCHVSFNGHDFTSEKLLIKSWNTRHTIKSSSLLVKDLEGFPTKKDMNKFDKSQHFMIEMCNDLIEEIGNLVIQKGQSND